MWWKCAVSESQHEHRPVLVEPLVRLAEPRVGQVVLDGTVGLGGHGVALLPLVMPGGRYIGLDVDEEMVAVARERLAELSSGGVDLLTANYADFPEVLERLGVPAVDLMLLDLGVNSAQLADAARGFSFDRDGPLDMRFDRGQGRQAIDLVNGLSESELADVFYFNAQEGGSRRIARRICQVRHSGRITTTLALARAVESAFGGRGGLRPGKTHAATRVFQALRVAVNAEYDNLRAFLKRAIEYLRPGGKLVVISFHSLEDGIVKQFMREAHKAGQLEEMTKRPVIADPEERRGNPRSRSAKMRIARRLESRSQ